jgi:glycosyltransferase involved in cell wall biosynthesis
VRRFAGGLRGRDHDVFVAPQSVEPELFARVVSQDEIESFRGRHDLPAGPLILYAGRLVTEKGVAVLLEAWPRLQADATLVIVGDGPLLSTARATRGTRALGPLARAELPVAYAASELALLPSIPTARFREPWGLVCNEAMHQGRPVVATSAVGAVAGGLVRDGDTGLVVEPGDAHALSAAIDRLLADQALRNRLGAAARAEVSGYTYEAMVAAFDRALAAAARARGD